MSRRVLVYRAEPGAQNAFDHGPSPAGVTPPEERKPLGGFTIADGEPDELRAAAKRGAAKLYREQPESVQLLADGSVSVTLRAPSR